MGRGDDAATTRLVRAATTRLVRAAPRLESRRRNRVPARLGRVVVRASSLRAEPPALQVLDGDEVDEEMLARCRVEAVEQFADENKGLDYENSY